ncbi:hypothetical protein D3C85_1507360 [compost metagenome]
MLMLDVNVSVRKRRELLEVHLNKVKPEREQVHLELIHKEAKEHLTKVIVLEAAKVVVTKVTETTTITVQVIKEIGMLQVAILQKRNLLRKKSKIKLRQRLLV